MTANYHRRCHDNGPLWQRIPACTMDCHFDTAELPIQMLGDDPLPPPFDVVDAVISWMLHHFIGIVAVCVVAGLSIGAYAKYFI